MSALHHICLLLRADGSIEKREYESGKELRDVYKEITRMSLCDFRQPPIDMRNAPFSEAQRVVMWTVFASDTFQNAALSGDEQRNNNATLLLHAGNSAHKSHNLQVFGECVLSATLAYVKPNKDAITCDSCPIDLCEDDFYQLLQSGHVSKSITSERCQLHCE